ncbi:MAG: DNA repair and recombination protein RadB [Nanoarchaeota archaeon]
MDIILPEPMKSLLGTLEKKALINFYGAPGTGKTNICLIAAVECIKKGGKVAYIDTEGGFSVERLKQITGDYQQILDNTELIEPRNLKEQGEAIKKLENTDADLIILDSSVSLYRLEYSDGRQEIIDNSNKICTPNSKVLEANRELSKQISELSFIARQKNIPVIITAHAFKPWNGEPMDLVGGDMMKYWSKIIVHIEKTNKMSERKATILKHRYMPEGKTMKFVLVNEGIKPAGFKLF